MSIFTRCLIENWMVPVGWYAWVWTGIFRCSFSIKWRGWKDHFQLNTGLFKPVREATSSPSFRYHKVNQEKDSANAKEQNEKWKFENEKESPLQKTERYVINPQKPLCPQYLNGALRETISLSEYPRPITPWSVGYRKSPRRYRIPERWE